MTTARFHADHILERSRDIRTMESAPRHIKRAALLDITLAVAKTAADNSVTTINQSYGMRLGEKLAAVRKLATLWRAVCKNVKVKHDDHPVSMLHMHATLCAYHPDIARNYESLFRSDLSYAHQHELFNAGRVRASSAVKRVVEQYF